MKRITRLSKYFTNSPAASNTTNAKDTFFYRGVYDFLEKLKTERKNVLDLWEGKNLLYGRVDFYDQPIFPRPEKLKDIVGSTKKKPLQTLDFVADAFNDFREFYVASSGCPDISNMSSDLTPTAAWKNINELYNIHINKMFDIFVNDWILKDPEKNNKITGLRSFMNLFLNFVEQKASIAPFTRANFLISALSTPLISGLVVEVAKEEHSNDKNKFDKYVEDQKFLFFKNAAMRFGFFIDKNAPWRLIANIDSPAMDEYKLKYGVTSNNQLFDRYYFRAHYHELDILKPIMYNYYNSFVAAEPNYCSFGQRKYRKQINPTSYNEIEQKDWLRLWVYIRAMEENNE